MPAGKLVVLSGPSGVGKDTVIDCWATVNPLVTRVVSATTRAPRAGERDQIDYQFLSLPTFLEMVERDQFLEHKEVYGNRYGTPRSHVEQLLSEGRVAVLKIDVQGALTVMDLRRDALSVFLQPPSREELIRRLVGRGTESGPDLERRVAGAINEMGLAGHYRFQVINDGLEQTVAELERIIGG